MATRGQTNLYMKNFGQDIDESKLCQLFSVYGTITSCKIATNENGQSKGFGYVNFERPDMATNTSEKLNGYRLEDGKNLFVGPFQKKSERQNQLRRIHTENLNQRSNDLCLYISNMDMMIDEKILDAIFNKFGQVTKTHILRNGTQSKGVGFVCFSTTEETARALNEMNGKWILSKPIYVKMSRSPEHFSNSPTPPAIAPPPGAYLNIPPMFYVPAMMIPRTPTPTVRPYPLLPPSSNTTTTHRLFYPYNRVKSDDQ